MGRSARTQVGIMVVVAGLFASGGPGATLWAQDGPEAEIARASRAFSEAYVRGDTATIRRLYTPDAVLLPPGREVRGRDDIARYFAPGRGRVNLEHAMRSSEVRVMGETAVDVGTWHNVWRVGEGEARTASERYLVVWSRGQDGRWRMAYDMWHRP